MTTQTHVRLKNLSHPHRPVDVLIAVKMDGTGRIEVVPVLKPVNLPLFRHSRHQRHVPTQRSSVCSIVTLKGAKMNVSIASPIKSNALNASIKIY